MELGEDTFVREALRADRGNCFEVTECVGWFGLGDWQREAPISRPLCIPIRFPALHLLASPSAPLWGARVPLPP